MAQAAESISSGLAPLRRAGRVGELENQLKSLFRRLRMAVVYGGDKNSEGAVINHTGNPRAWKSYEIVANDIAAALKRCGISDVIVVPEDMRLGERLRQHGTHLAWLNSGGVQGYAPVSHAPAMLEMLGIPYIGHDPLTAAILDNKHSFKRQMKAAGIPTAPFYVWQAVHGPLDPYRDIGFCDAFEGWKGSFIVKPVSGRASLNVHHVERRDALPDIIARVYGTTQNHVLVETYLPGREYCVGVTGPVVARQGKLWRMPQPFAFSAVERLLEADEPIFTSMDVKPISGSRMRVIAPGDDPPLFRRIEEIAWAVFDDMSLETLVRLDIRADEKGRLFVLEANPKPDLKFPAEGVTSLIAAGLPAEGMTYDDLILSLLADRIDVLFSRKRGSAEPILKLVR